MKYKLFKKNFDKTENIIEGYKTMHSKASIAKPLLSPIF